METRWTAQPPAIESAAHMCVGHVASRTTRVPSASRASKILHPWAASCLCRSPYCRSLWARCLSAKLGQMQVSQCQVPNVHACRLRPRDWVVVIHKPRLRSGSRIRSRSLDAGSPTGASTPATDSSVAAEQCAKVALGVGEDCRPECVCGSQLAWSSVHARVLSWVAESLGEVTGDAHVMGTTC